MATSAPQMSHVPSNVRQPRPVMFRPLYRLIPAGIVLALATAWNAKLTLPYTGLEVQQIPAYKCAEPAPLEGPLAENNRLFSSSVVKIFPEVQGSGRPMHPCTSCRLFDSSLRMKDLQTFNIAVTSRDANPLSIPVHYLHDCFPNACALLAWLLSRSSGADKMAASH